MNDFTDFTAEAIKLHNLEGDRDDFDVVSGLLAGIGPLETQQLGGQAVAALKKAKQAVRLAPAVECLDLAYLEGLPTEEERARLLSLIVHGIQDPISPVGCIAQATADYVNFKPFFAALTARVQGVGEPLTGHPASEWVPPDDTSMSFERFDEEVRASFSFSRNFSGYPLPAGIDRDERVALETRLQEAFLGMSESWPGRYFSLSPGSLNSADKQVCDQLIEMGHLMPYPDGATQIGSAKPKDWPHGRGTFVFADGRGSVWVGDDDHIKLNLSVEQGSFENLLETARKFLDGLEKAVGVEFAADATFGHITSCVDKIGTGMTGTVHRTLSHALQTEESEEICRRRRIGFEITDTKGLEYRLSIGRTHGITEVGVARKLFECMVLLK